MDFEPLPPDPYAALGVDKAADAAAIKSAYRKLALKYHPDKCTNDAQRETNTQQFHNIQKAYDLVGTEEERKRHDALVRLHELRDEKLKLHAGRHPGRPPTRSYSQYATATTTTASNKSYNFEERRPKFADAHDLPRSSPNIRAEAYAKRPVAQPVRVERDTRSKSYDYPDGKSTRGRDYDDAYERTRRKDSYGTPTERKYASIEQAWARHTAKYDESERPSIHPRRSSTREVPLFETRRSKASPRDYRDYEDRREYLDELSARDIDIARRVAEAYLRKKEARREREREAREREIRDRERSRERERERERDRDRDRLRDRPRERDRDRRRGSREEEPVDRRPATLQQSFSSPPYVPGGATSSQSLPRAQTYTSTTNTEPIPPFERSSTMPSIPTAANTSAKREKQPSDSKLKNSTTLADSGYSSASQPEDKNASRKSKSTKYAYPSYAEYPYQFETRAPGGTSSPTERPSPSRRPSYPVEASRVLADRTRRGRERERERENDRGSDYRSNPSTEKLYGEMGPGYPPGHPPRVYAEEDIKRAKRYDNIQYSSSPRLHHSNTMPVGAS
jgi:curved DNA-binding protein CbpA